MTAGQSIPPEDATIQSSVAQLPAASGQAPSVKPDQGLPDDGVMALLV